MSACRNLRYILLCTVLQLGALMGAPVLPRDLDHLMRTMHQNHLEESTPGDSGHSQDGGLDTEIEGFLQ
jgi:hypothetical protein